MSSYFLRLAQRMSALGWCWTLMLAVAAAAEPASLDSFRDADEPPAPPWHEPAAAKAPSAGYPRTAARPDLSQPHAAIEPLEAELFAAETKSTASTRLASQHDELKSRIRQALALYYPKKLNTRDHNAWEIMHAIVAYGVKTEVLQGGPTGEPISAIGWLGFNGQCRGGPLMMIENGRVAARQGVNVQGHYGQFLAILAQSRLQRDYPLRVDGREFTIEDLIETEQLGCLSGTELTFKLIALMHYLPSDAEWKNRYGETWSIRRLIEEEIKAPIRGAPCGGTHRLMGLSYAVQKRLQRGEPVEGEFLRAKQYIDEYHKYTFALQNPDGSFSTEWFKGRGNRLDTDRKLQTTGHILEWLAFSLPHDHLTDARTIRAVEFLNGILLAEPERAWEIGPLGHGLHALAIYDYRMFQNPPSVETQQAAAKSAEAAGQAISAKPSKPAAEKPEAPKPISARPLPPVMSTVRAPSRSPALPVPQETAEPPLPRGDAAPLANADISTATEPTPHGTATIYPGAHAPTPEPDTRNRGIIRRPFVSRARR